MLRVRQAERLARVLARTDGTGSRGGRRRACRGSRSGSGTTRPKRAATSGPRIASLCGGHQQLEADLEAVDEERRLGRDQLVRPREVRRVASRRRARAGATARPTGREGRSAACGRAGGRGRRASGGARRRRASAVRRDREQVDVAVDARERASCLWRSSSGQSTNSSRCSVPRAPARLADVRRLAAPHRRERVPLGDVGVPELVVRDERAAGPEDDRPRLRRAAARRRGRRATPSADAPEDRVVGRAVGRAALDLAPGQERVADVHGAAGRAARRAGAPTEAPPGRRSRARRAASGGRPRSTLPPLAG